MCGASPSLSLCSQDSRQSLSHVFKVSGKCGDAANNLTSLLWIFPPSYFPSCSIDPGRFPGQQQHMFDHQNPGLLINSNNHQIPSQGHMAFNQPGLGGFNQPGQGPGGQLGMFQREPPRPNLPPQGHPQSLTGHSGPTNTRLFMGHRQPGFPQQQGTPGPFPSQQLQFGMQVRMRVSESSTNVRVWRWPALCLCNVEWNDSGVGPQLGMCCLLLKY